MSKIKNQKSKVTTKTKTKKTTKKNTTAGAAETVDAKKPKASSSNLKPLKAPKSPSKRNSASIEPSTMAQLLEQEGVELRDLQRGDVIEGEITDITSKSIYVDIGAKTEGLVTDKEYRLAHTYIQTLAVGDTVDVYVLTPENDSGQIILSLRSAASDYLWNQLEQWLAASEVITVRVKEVNRGGAVVNVIDQLDGFIPGSQFGSQVQSQQDKLVNKDIEVKIIDLDRADSKIILSEKAVSEAEDIAQKKAALEALEPGRAYDGEITRVVPFGIFVQLAVPSTSFRPSDDEGGEEEKSHTPKSRKKISPPRSNIGGRNDNSSKQSREEEGSAPEGLVHISELSWEKVDDPKDEYKVGDKIKVKVLEVEPAKGKLALSVKQLTPDPWDQLADKYPVDKQVKGEVTEVHPYGIFVRLEPGISGLIHSTKLLGQTFKPGDKVNIYIESVDKSQRRLSLGLVLTAKPVGYK